MHILMIILAALGTFIALLLIIALFMKKTYAIERQVTINRPKQQVFDYIRYLKNQDNYSKWNMADPEAKKTYTGTDGTVGFAATWDSANKQVGKGEQKIKTIVEGERLEIALHFIKPMEGRAEAYMTTTAASDQQTIVKWGMGSSMKYPMNVMMLFLNFEKLLGNDMQEGLSNLKAILEK